MFRKTGFTLTEMLLTASLVSVIGMSLLAVFNNGTMLWEKITRKVVAEDVDMFFEKISFDLRNTFLFESIAFQGKAEDINVPVVVSSTEQSQGIGRTDYVFERGKKILEKRQFDFSGVYRGRSVSRRTLVRHVDTLRFTYYYHDQKSDSYGWTSVWPDENVSFDENKKEMLPLAVRIEIGVKDNDVLRQFARTVSIPAGCCRPPVED